MSLVLELEKEILKRRLAQKKFSHFVTYTMPSYQMTPIHEVLADVLNLFAYGRIKKLIVTMPPQHGKTELSTKRLSSFILGINPNLQIAIASYSATQVRKFSIHIQRIISDRKYHNIFPDTLLQNNSDKSPLISKLSELEEKIRYSEIANNWGKRAIIERQIIELENKIGERGGLPYIKTMEEFEVVGHSGALKAIGRGGPLTGNLVDIMILDDLYKDYTEGNSPVTRESVLDWYKSVVRTRLHNDSQELITFTRWHDEDLIGSLEKSEKVILLTKREQLENPDPTVWYKVNFPALATEECKLNEFDGRELGEPIWAKRHSKAKLENDRNLDPEKFESLHQGDPRPKTGLLFSGFGTYMVRPKMKYRKNYTDTADQGSDFLCSINYEVGMDDNIYIIDVYYTQEPQEVTEPGTAEFLNRFGRVHATIESNNGGRAFARNVDRLSGKKHTIDWFHQSENKESRILTNAAELQRRVFFPYNWEGKWPGFSNHILKYRRNFKANKYHDGIDALTGCLEHSGLILDGKDSLYKW